MTYFREHIMQMAGYTPGEQPFRPDGWIKLNTNENPYPPSPKVKEALLCLSADELRFYPNPTASSLLEVIAGYLGLKKENVIAGNGSDDIIALLCHGFLNEGDEALMPLPSFLMYEISVKTAKGVPVMVPLNDFSTNLQGLVKKITSKTRLIFITNPFNPTGSTISFDEFNDFAQQVPDDVIIVVDEAYIEFVRDDQIYNSLKNPLHDSRIVSLRTFSKAYGLAGFRIGYGIMEASVAGVLNKIRQPFNVNSLAQVAAVAALDDEMFLNKSIKTTHESLDFFFKEFADMEIQCLVTQANFFMIDIKTDAKEVFEQMLQLGVIVRSMESYGFDTFLRVNTGTPEENKAFLKALKIVLGK
jgi:histidinol-phosphate aminotransferase